MPLQPLPCLLFLSPSLTQTYVTRLSSPNKTSCTVTPSPCSPEARRARTREEVVERKKKLRSSVTPLNSEGNAQRSYRTTSVWETEWKFMKGYRVVWTFSWNVWVRGGGETEGDCGQMQQELLSCTDGLSPEQKLLCHFHRHTHCCGHQ